MQPTRDSEGISDCRFSIWVGVTRTDTDWLTVLMSPGRVGFSPNRKSAIENSRFLPVYSIQILTDVPSDVTSRKFLVLDSSSSTLSGLIPLFRRLSWASSGREDRSSRASDKGSASLSSSPSSPRTTTWRLAFLATLLVPFSARVDFFSSSLGSSSYSNTPLLPLHWPSHAPREQQQLSPRPDGCR